jgi:hypothetical protein
MFWLQTTRAINDEAGLYLRITVDGKRLNVSLKKRIPIDLWDANKKIVISTSIKARQLNHCIEEVKSKVFQIYQDLKYRDEIITAKIIKSRFTGDDEKSKSLIDLISYHGKKIENTLAKGSIRNFGVTESYLAKFLLKDKKTTDIYLKQLDYKFLCDFENYLAAV